jgi:Protein of unknown function (DUF707)
MVSWVDDLNFFFLLQIYVSTNPKGAEMLPPGIVASESDFYLRRLWGEPTEVCKEKKQLCPCNSLFL